MDNAFITAGIVAILAAVVGGGLKGLGFEIPVLASWWRQIALGCIGLLLLMVGLKLLPFPAKSNLSQPLAVTVTGWSSPSEIRFGQGTAIHITLMTEHSTAVSGATVVIRDASGGKFLVSGSGTVEGMTDDRGTFQAFWAPPAGGSAGFYEMQAKVTKDGVVLGIVSVTVNVHV